MSADDVPGVGVASAFMSPQDVAELLVGRMMKLPPENLCQPAYACFQACYRAVRRFALRCVPREGKGVLDGGGGQRGGWCLLGTWAWTAEDIGRPRPGPGPTRSTPFRTRSVV